MKNNFGIEISRMLNDRKISRKELANQTGIPYTTLTDWINGKTKPKEEKIEKIASFFGVTVDELNGRPNNVFAIDSWKNIPILGNIACGSPILANENIDGFQAIPSNLVPQDNVFGLKCKGDSMEPTIKNGALVIIHQQPTIEDNEIAAVLINDSATLKRVKHVDNTILLLPDNQKYSPIVLNENDDNRILGKMILQINQY